MLYRFYRHKYDSNREVVVRDGAEFPGHLNAADWFLHETHTAVNGRTDADIETLGYCDRVAGAPFGRKLSAGHHPSLLRRSL